jgi:hypothetical protein
MEKGNKILFAFGILIILIFSNNILINGITIKSIVALLTGLSFVWKHGFTKDTESWKIKPKISLFITFILVLIIPFIFNQLYFNKSKTIHKLNSFNANKFVIEENKKLPIAIEGNDSVIEAKLINYNTIQYLSKLDINRNDIDSLKLLNFVQEIKYNMTNKLKNQKKIVLNMLLKDRINFSYKYVDSSGNYITNIIIDVSEYSK